MNQLRFREDRRGLTLIELVLVVAILGIMASLVGSSFASAYGAYANECATDLEAVLSKTRMDSLSKQGSICLEIYKTDKGVFARINSVVRTAGVPEIVVISDEKIGDSRVDIRYTPKGGSPIDVTDTTHLHIAYARSTGAFRTLAYAEGLLLPGNPENTGAFCEKIEVMSGGRTATLTLVPQTGRHSRG